MMVAPTSRMWMDIYDSFAPRHASALSDALHIGAVLNEPNTARVDTRSGILSLSWILTGTGVYKDAEQTYSLDGGTLVLRRPSSPGIISLDAHSVHRRCFIHIDDCAARLFTRLIPQIDRFPSVTRLPFNDELFDRFTALISLAESSGESDPWSMLPMFCDILLALLRPDADRVNEAIAIAPQLIASMPPSTQLPEIAARVGVPYGQFRKRFAQVYGVAPGQWRINRRIERAKQELAGGDTIQRVAERLEYADVFAFTHQFRDVVGATPKAYQLNNID